MIAEPVYSFVKGVGWVIQQHRVIVHEHCGYRIIIENRKPIAGEWWWADSVGYPFEESAANVKAMLYDVVSIENFANRKGHNFNEDDYQSDHTFVSVRFEKL